MKDLLKDDKCKKGYPKMTLRGELFRYSETHKTNLRIRVSVIAVSSVG
jgi:hypothetical protein